MPQEKGLQLLLLLCYNSVFQFAAKTVRQCSSHRTSTTFLNFAFSFWILYFIKIELILHIRRDEPTTIPTINKQKSISQHGSWDSPIYKKFIPVFRSIFYNQSNFFIFCYCFYFVCWLIVIWIFVCFLKIPAWINSFNIQTTK